jgi:hypothetical protein
MFASAKGLIWLREQPGVSCSTNALWMASGSHSLSIALVAAKFRSDCGVKPVPAKWSTQHIASDTTCREPFGCAVGG